MSVCSTFTDENNCNHRGKKTHSLLLKIMMLLMVTVTLFLTQAT